MTADKAFISTAELTNRIKERTSGLESGKTSLAALDELLDDIRELEERIIVIRYKGMERLRMEDVPLIFNAPIVTVPRPDEAPIPVKPVTPFMGKGHAEEEQTAVIESLPVVEEPLVPVDVPTTNQISLIDSIEELSKDIGKQGGLEEISAEPLSPAKKVEMPKENPQGISDQGRKVSESGDQVRGESSVNEKKGPVSYAEKMERRPVGNIKKELNLNQRLGLARVLAPGDDKGLDRILSEVDSAASKEQAAVLLKAAAGDRWDGSIELMEQLMDIVERKFK